MLENIRESDPDLFEGIKKELARQRDGLEMIPSENFTSLAVMEACGSILTNKYSEGYPGRRYYGGNENIDKIEALAIKRAKELFKVPFANVQPYSGSPANLSVYLSICKPGDKIMGLNLTDGGHLTHGWKTSVTGQIFESIPYHVMENGLIDIEEVRKLAESQRPKLIWIGATAYTRALPFEEFSKIAQSVGAYLAADISHISGLVVGGEHQSPVEFADIVVTTTHKTLRGPRGAIIMVTEKGLKKDSELGDKIDKIIFPGMQGGPHEHIIGGIAVSLLEAADPKFKDYARQIVKNSKALAERLKNNGIKLVSDGTDNHMLLIDLTSFGKGNGLFVQEALDSAGITVNKNTIPKEPSSPFYPSGIRLGTPALTTRGMKEKEMEQIADMITEIIKAFAIRSLAEDKVERQKQIKAFREELQSSGVIKEVSAKVVKICRMFPLYPELNII